MVYFTIPINVRSILIVYHTRKGSQIYFQLLLVLSGLVSPKSFWNTIQKAEGCLNSIYEELGDVHVRTVCLQVQIQVGEVCVKVQEQLSESSVRFSKLQFWWRLTLFSVLNLSNEHSMLNNLWNFQCSLSNSSDFLRLLWIQDTHLPLFEF